MTHTDHCPFCKVRLVYQYPVKRPTSEWDRCVCPRCKMTFAMHWHPVGEPVPQVERAA